MCNGFLHKPQQVHLKKEALVCSFHVVYAFSLVDKFTWGENVSGDFAGLVDLRLVGRGEFLSSLFVMPSCCSDPPPPPKAQRQRLVIHSIVSSEDLKVQQNTEPRS